MHPVKTEEQQRFDTLFNTSLQQNNVLIFVQPQHQINNQRISDIECLGRWKLPDGTIMCPDIFFSYLRCSEHLKAYNQLLLDKALQYWDLMHDQGWNQRIAINVDASAVVDHMVDMLHAARRKGRNVDGIEIELTEYGHHYHMAELRDAIVEIRNIGATVALDDFGTGYSNYELLASCPFDKIKLDKQFLLHDSQLNSLVLRHVADIGQILNMKVVIEGVESDDAEKRAFRHGYLYGQGFFYSRPVPFDVFIEKLIQHQAKPRHLKCV